MMPSRRWMQSYAENVTDEFVVPCVLGDYAGMQDGDALLFANFRADRAREISAALLDQGFEGFKRARIVQFAAAAGLTEYSDALKPLMAAIFPPEDVRETLGEVIAEHHMKQLRIAETEKYAHVTFFLNGGREDQFDGEDRILVPSPKVATYDHKPEMSAYQVTEKLEEAIGCGKYDLIVCNYANPDMVGHTGVMDAAVKAVDTIDECLGRLRAALEKAGGVMLLTADHGNIEMMEDPKTHEPYTAHTTLDVPIIAFGAPKGARSNNGRLADVAPTMLDLMGLEKPGADDGPFPFGERGVRRNARPSSFSCCWRHRRACAAQRIHKRGRMLRDRAHAPSRLHRGRRRRSRRWISATPCPARRWPNCRPAPSS